MRILLSHLLYYTFFFRICEYFSLCTLRKICNRVNRLPVFFHGKIQVAALFAVVFCRHCHITDRGSFCNRIAFRNIQIRKLPINSLISISQFHRNRCSGLGILLNGKYGSVHCRYNRRTFSCLYHNRWI